MLQRTLSHLFYHRRLLVLVIVTCLWLLPILSVEAQCGSQASSCKNCHETQGELPVNNDGNGWHESHAFGDFCYICHAGNQQSTVAEEAHTGMVDPLSDVKASCQMCHADDLTERVEVYTSILGYDSSSSESSSDSESQTADTSSDTESTGDSDTASDTESTGTTTTDTTDTAVATSEKSSECVGLSSDIVIDDASATDYTQRYNEIVLGERPVNEGNIALGILIGLLVFGGGGFILVNEIRVSASRVATAKAEGEYPVDVIEMLPALSALKIQTRKALSRILSNPQKTDQVLGLIDTVISDEEPEEPKQ